MVSCERCWRMASMRAKETCVDTADEYRKLVLVNDCTVEQQAGEDATTCPKCEVQTVHQITKQCIACGWDKSKPEDKP